MPVGVGVVALLVTVAIGSVRNGANRVPAGPSKLKIHAAGAPPQPVVTPLPTPLMTPAVLAPAPALVEAVDAVENRPVTAPRAVRPARAPLAQPAGAQPVVAAPALAPAADPEVTSTPRVGQRVQARTRPPRPIDVGDPYAP